LFIPAAYRTLSYLTVDAALSSLSTKAFCPAALAVDSFA